jgi:hypothetical protein
MVMLTFLFLLLLVESVRLENEGVPKVFSFDLFDSPKYSPNIICQTFQSKVKKVAKGTLMCGLSLDVKETARKCVEKEGYAQK